MEQTTGSAMPTSREEFIAALNGLKEQVEKEKRIVKTVLELPILQNLRQMHEEAMGFFRNLDETHTTREVLEAHKTVETLVQIKDDILGKCIERDTTEVNLGQLEEDVRGILERFAMRPSKFDVSEEQSYAVSNVLHSLLNIILTLKVSA